MVKTINFTKFISNLNSMSIKIHQDLENAVMESALNIETNAKMDCPVNMGILRSSIHSENISQGKEIAWRVSTNIPYAPYVEFGTGTNVSIPVGYDEYAYQFKGEKDIKGMNAQPYLIPNFEMEIGYLRTKLTNILENVQS